MLFLNTFTPWWSERFYWMATPALAAVVEICLTNVKLCCFHFFYHYCHREDGCLPAVLFLSHCNLLRPHPYLSIVAIAMVVVTGWWCCLDTLYHIAVFPVATCKADGWPALLEFQTLVASLKTCWENFGLCFKKKTSSHAHTHWHVSFYLKELLPLYPFLSPTHSSFLTLFIAETTCVLFNWIFQGRVFSVFSRHFRVVGVTVCIVP